MQSKKAFTLIELLVVISIVGILSGFIAVSMNGAVGAAKDAKRKADLDTLRKALIMYSVEHDGTYPTEDLETALSPYAATIPVDPNGNDYVYESDDGSTFTVSTTLSNDNGYSYSPEEGFVTTGSVDGACGSANKNYNGGVSTYGADTFCNPGNPDPSSPVFPTPGTPTTWVCNSPNGGAPSGTCTATKTAWTYVYFNSSTSWTVPAGVTSIDVYVLGGGGGGGDNYCGGGGGYTTNVFEFSVTPGASIPVVVGAGGPNGQGAYGYFGGDGGTSSFSGITANGGKGCSQDTTVYGAGGSGGGGAGGPGGSDGTNGGGSTSFGLGQGSSTRPFLDSSFNPLGGGGGGKGGTVTGGFYGGGAGCAGDYCSGTSGLPNTGGGGGSMWGAGQHTGAGGSGVVIVRY